MESPLNLEFMLITDEIYTESPFYGVPWITHISMLLKYLLPAVNPTNATDQSQSTDTLEVVSVTDRSIYTGY
jgi:hypothetical protein